MDVQMEMILKGGQFKKLLEEQSLELRQKYDMKKAELEILYFLSHSGMHDTSTDIHQQLLMNRGEEMNQKILEGISEEELRVFREVSEKIRKNIENIL